MLWSQTFTPPNTRIALHSKRFSPEDFVELRATEIDLMDSTLWRITLKEPRISAPKNGFTAEKVFCRSGFCGTFCQHHDEPSQGLWPSGMPLQLSNVLCPENVDRCLFTAAKTLGISWVARKTPQNIHPRMVDYHDLDLGIKK